ncbi:MAG: preprotein translocase subunit SecE [Rhodospirillaceae bacterium]|jgi:preprotein translocase subunit SecE|nr:preprotein translocase subunit SecE [Rhodospirillaceae bacterium]
MVKIGSIGLFFRQVRQEVTKVTWPSRKETIVFTGMVFLMVTFVSIFFLIIDQFFSYIVKLIFGLGS